MAGTNNGTREVRMLVGLLVAVMAGVILTAWTDAGAQSITKPTARAVAPSPDPGHMESDLYFDSNSARLRADAAKTIQEKVAFTKLGGTWTVVLEGHADRYGTPEYNKDLAKRRAEVVKQFLMDLGVPETSVSVVVVGQDGSVCDGPSRQCQGMNRRVHMEMRKTTEGAASPVTSR